MAQLQFDQSRNGGTATAQIGDLIEIRLPENPTTGYRWQLPPLDGGATVELESDEYDVSSPAVGSGGLRRLSFRAVREGACTIDLHYRRSWEKQAADSFTMTIDVAVQAK
jgi:inhibitor of cysteine peptidase